MADAVLAGKRALITGGGRGIGAAIADKLAALGAHVTVTGRTESEIEAVAGRLGGDAIKADLSDRSSTDAMLAALSERGRVDVLVNNAGIASSAPLHKTDDAMWDRIMEVNVTSAFRITRALVPAMIEAGWGRVINLASNAGLSGYRYTAAYCASKHAMVGMTRALAVDVATSGVTINAVCPGWVETNMVKEAVERIASKTGRSVDQATQNLASMSPQNRLMQPDEIAHTVAMLCDRGARGIHGQTIVIDGGALLK